MKIFPSIAVTRAAAIMMLVTVALSWNLWFPLDSIGAMKVVPFEPPRWLNWGISCQVLSSLFLIAIFPTKRWFTMALSLTLSLSILIDCNRCQPWVLPFLFLLWVPDDLTEQEAMFPYAFLAGATYFLSGIQKFNPAFQSEAWPWILQAFGQSGYKEWSWFLPGYEILTGILLFIPKLQRIAIPAGIFMHVMIVYILAFHQWNFIVLPWNLMMIVVLLFLWWHHDPVQYPGMDYRVVVLCLLFMLPVCLGLTGIISRSFSLPLYSGKQYSGIIVFNQAAFNRLPSDLKEIAEPIKTSADHFINLDRCSMHQQGVPLFQAQESYIRYSKQFLPVALDDFDFVVLIRNGNEFKYAEDFWILNVSDIRNNKSSYGAK